MTWFDLFGDERLAFIRECVDFIEATNQTPSKEQLNDTAKQLCDRVPSIERSKEVNVLGKYMYTTLGSLYSLGINYANMRLGKQPKLAHYIRVCVVCGWCFN